MNDEELKYYIALQPFFRKKMGEWQTGDWVFHKEKRKVFWVAYPEGSFLFVYNREYGSYREIFRSNAIFLPLPIDPVNPERGLWGMVKQWRDEPCLRRVEGGSYSIQAHARVFYADTPTFALLKALAAQEGVERRVSGRCVKENYITK